MRVRYSSVAGESFDGEGRGWALLSVVLLERWQAGDSDGSVSSRES